ncbi:uncharacterized protein EI90DRAFT_3015910 [Cantharellus anzutake]|uniref:uncharacterized protein n=1 Tax=Cantharellus anzutake TaxID=1750568 RepID=UPI001905F885|nr:uncharacterized protein EI90DRAFT_3020572 [Cantharellus anzutake]XP_038916744.1 uncharacterized protein EI90DRAFT_3015910 [Cantharellus anzutake]KAF8320233.1 hypothetical protein EI90DRAFT_3020572 [Cantharellus anzutake]KAF8332301.1 hypothetical protein EI90DRAFT_3015910 [Cantharellus anzutake]
MRFFTVIAFAFSLPLFIVASPLPHDGGSSYSGSTGEANGGSVSGDGGIHLVKLLSHNAQNGGKSSTGLSSAGPGGNDLVTNRKSGKHGTSSGFTGGSAYSGTPGPSGGGNAQTDKSISVLDVLSDNAAPGGESTSGPARGGSAGNQI